MSSNDDLRDHIEVHETHEIKREAEKLFESMIPSGWIDNKFGDKDYGKDYHLELTKQVARKANLGAQKKRKPPTRTPKAPTGKELYVQLKGQETGDYRLNNSVIVENLKLRHLTYYADACVLPVFLVIADLAQKKGYWLFIQEYLVSKKSWRIQASTDIHVPVSQDLSNLPSFEKAIYDAISYMKALRSFTLRELVDDRVKKLEQLDPRFRVEPTITREEETYHMNPKEPVALSLKFLGKHDCLADLIDKGQEVEFKPGELVITGSALFQDVEQTGVTLRIGHDYPGTMTMTCLDAEKVELARWENIPGTFTGGSKERHFASTLANSPLGLAVGPMAKDVPGNVNVTVKTTVWNNQHLRSLSYFDKTHTFLDALPRTALIVLEAYRDGNRTGALTVPAQNVEQFEPMCDLAVFLEKARRVAAECKINPIVRDSLLTEKGVSEINIAHAILFEGGASIPAKKAIRHITFHIPKDDSERLLAMSKDYHDVTWYATKDQHMVTILSEKVKAGPVKMTLTQTTMLVIEKPSTTQQKEPTVTIAHQFSPTDDTMLTVCKITTEEYEAEMKEDGSVLKIETADSGVEQQQ